MNSFHRPHLSALYGSAPSNTLVMVFLLTVLVASLAGISVSTMPHIIPFAIITGLFIFILTFANPHYVMVILLYAMLLSPELSMGGVGNRGQEVVIRFEDLLLIAFTIAWLAKTAVKGRVGLIRPTPLNKVIGFYTVMFVLSTVKGMLLMNVTPLSGFFNILKYFEYFLMFFLVRANIENKTHMRMFVQALIFTFIIVNIYAYLQIPSGHRVSSPFEGTAGEPNTLGGYQVLLLALMIGILTHARTKWWKIPLATIAIFSFVPFAYTLSRASYMAIIPTYLTLIGVTRTRARSALIIILIIAGVLGLFFFPQNVKDRITDAFTPEYQEGIPPVEMFGVTLGPSASARIHSWVSAYRKWLDKPFLGYGVTGAGFLDSQYFRTLVELGVIGTLAFLALVTVITRTTWRIYRKATDPLYKGIAAGFLAGHIGMLVHALTANTFIIIRIMEPYWFIAAMVVAIPDLEKSRTPATTLVPKDNGGTGKNISSNLPTNIKFLLQSNTRA